MASLGALILQDELEVVYNHKVKVEAVGFETPPIMSDELLAVVKRDYNVTNVVLGFDIIPFASLKNLAELRKRVGNIRLTDEFGAFTKG